jgi:hypothetical protein
LLAARFPEQHAQQPGVPQFRQKWFFRSCMLYLACHVLLRKHTFAQLHPLSLVSPK